MRRMAHGENQVQLVTNGDRIASLNLDNRGVPKQRCASCTAYNVITALQELSRLSLGSCTGFLIVHFSSGRSAYGAGRQTDEREERGNAITTTYNVHSR